MYNSKIIGLGKYLPDNVVTNADLEKIMETSDAWIQERTGIQERRHIAKDSDDSTSSMGVKASKIAIERAGLLQQDIDLILFATLSPDYYFPGSGVLVQEALEIPDCPAMDIRMQCSGFVYAVATADQFIKTGMYKNVLVIGSEYHSGGLDMTTRGSVSIALDVVVHLSIAQAKLLLNKLGNAQIGLVGHQPRDVFRGEVVLLHDVIAHIGHALDGCFEYRLAILRDVVLLGVNRFVRGRMQRATGFLAEEVGTCPVYVEFVVNDPVFFRGLEQHSRGGVTKQNAGGAIGVVDDGAHFVRPYNDHLFVPAALNELGTGGQGKNESRACCAQVIPPRVHRPHFVCD